MATKQLNLPIQKSFKFKRGTTIEKIDSVVNEWLKEIVLKGSVPFKIESYCTFWGATIMTYLYTIGIEVEVADAPPVVEDELEAKLKEHLKDNEDETN